MLDSLGAIYLSYANQKRGPASDAVVEEYERSKAAIEEILRQTEFFHGTGRFAYTPKGASKYEGIHTDQEMDVLERLLQDGLKPQEDLFSDLFVGEELATVSLTHLRMYARVYADLFEDKEKTSLEYKHGPQAFWWQFLLAKMFLHMLTDKEYWSNTWRYYFSERFKPEMEHRFKQRRARMDHWQRTFRNDDKYKLGTSLSELVGLATSGTTLNDLMSYSGSTIQNNHGLIIGIKAGAVAPVPLQQGYVRSFEARSAGVIPPTDWTYLEVPQSKIEATAARVREVGLTDLPVLPMELMEHHHAQQPLSKLSKKYEAASEGLTRPNL